MNGRSSPPRITFEVDPEVRRKIDALIPWGWLTPIYQAITDDLIDLLEDEENVRAILGGIALRKVKLQDYLQIEDSHGSRRTAE